MIFGSTTIDGGEEFFCAYKNNRLGFFTATTVFTPQGHLLAVLPDRSFETVIERKVETPAELVYRMTALGVQKTFELVLFLLRMVRWFIFRLRST